MLNARERKVKSTRSYADETIDCNSLAKQAPVSSGLGWGSSPIAANISLTSVSSGHFLSYPALPHTPYSSSPTRNSAPVMYLDRATQPWRSSTDSQPPTIITQPRILQPPSIQDLSTRYLPARYHPNCIFTLRSFALRPVERPPTFVVSVQAYPYPLSVTAHPLYSSAHFQAP